MAGAAPARKGHPGRCVAAGNGRAGAGVGMDSIVVWRHLGLLGAGLPLTGRAWAHEAWARQDAVFQTLVWGFPPT